MKSMDTRKHELLFYHHSREETPDQSQFFAHIHSEAEIYYLIEGSVEYRVEESIYLLQPGDLMIMRPGEVHAAYVDAHSPYERISLRFPLEIIKDTVNSRLLAPFYDRPTGVYNYYSASNIPTDFVKACFDQIFSQKESDSQRRTVTYLLPILQVIYDAWNTHEIPQMGQSSTLPSSIITYINQHLKDIKSVKQIADDLYMSQAQLYRVFRAHTGLSAWDYVRVKRLFAAHELIQNGTLPSNAAAECGFTEYSSFYRAYIKRFGHPPRDDYFK